MTRISNWPAYLAAFVEEKRDVPFKWGHNDCCLFACDWLKDLTGFDPAGMDGLGLRGLYRTANGAARILAKHQGTAGIADKVCSEMGWPSCSSLLVRRGDIVLLEGALGVCIGNQSIFPGETGIVFKSTGQTVRGWRVA